MSKKTTFIVVLLCLIMAGFSAYILEGNCCNEDELECCCNDFIEMGLILDEYMCVCSGERQLMRECIYIEFIW